MNRSETNETSGDTTTVQVPVTAEIVVGLNDSPSAAAALRWAAEQSRATGLPLRVVHAWQLKAIEVAAASAELWVAARADARAHTTRWVLDTLGGSAAEVHWSLDIVEGPPGPALVSRSHGARLLVLGTREHSGLRRVVLGSVSHYCLSHADPPVVAVPASPEAPATAGTVTGVLARPGPLL